MRKTGEKVLVWGDHYAAADTAAALAGMGKDVTIVTDKKEFAASVEVILSLIHIYPQRRFPGQFFRQHVQQAGGPGPGVLCAGRHRRGKLAPDRRA